MFTYLFWIAIKSIPKRINEYGEINKLNFFEKIRDVYLPSIKNLSILLFIIGFIFCFYENAKIQFIFKASRGTNTELINQWLNRTYQSNTLLSPNIAFEKIASVGIIVLIISIVVLFSFLLIKNFIYNRIITNKITWTYKFSSTNSVFFSTAILLLIFTFTVVPIFLVWIKQDINFDKNISYLLNPLLLTGIAAFVASFFAIFFAIISRMYWHNSLQNFNKKSMIFLLFLFLLIVVPPICTLILGFKWMNIFGYDSDLKNYLVWIVGHSVLCLPLLAGFSITTHFKLNNSHLFYLNSQKANLFETVKDLFVIPFKADYLLTLIIAFSLIWNEAIINKILSDIIPSYITELNKTIFGRSADYAKGMSFLLVSIVIAIACVLLWNYLLKKAEKSNKVLSA